MLNYSQIRIPNVSATERWASLIGGGVLTVVGLKAGSGRGKAMMIAGSCLLIRGIAGRSHFYKLLGIRSASPGQGRSMSVPYELGLRASAAVTINRSRAEMYAFWRELTNLPLFMRHLKEVSLRDSGLSHWVAEGPAGICVEWDAEVIQDIENELIGWRSLPGSALDAAGSVRFREAPGGRGCEILVELQYNPPAGTVGALFSKLFGRDPATDIEEDLTRLKQQLEAGEIPSTEGQPHGGRRRHSDGRNLERPLVSAPQGVLA